MPLSAPLHRGVNGTRFANLMDCHFKGFRFMIQTTKINSSSVFLVSGGAKGVTAQCVLRLAQQKKCKFILLGRSSILAIEPDWAKDCYDEFELKKRIMNSLISQGEKPTPNKVQKEFNAISSSREIQKTLSEIEISGGQAEYICVDVTDNVALQHKLKLAVERIGQVNGIIHGAGNLADKLIEKKSEADFETVYAAKVKGLENLLSCVPPSQLNYLVLFSSVSGFYGNPGQSDYAIANEILNKSAYLVKQHHPNCHVVAINWGPWDSGMVSPELKKAFAQRNIEIIPLSIGAQMLVDELDKLNDSNQSTQVIIGSPLLQFSSQPASQLNNNNNQYELKTYCIQRQLRLEANPFLHDHVIAGYPVLPATCALAWIINSCEQLYPGYKFLSSKNFKILKGIVFDETLASEYILELKETSKTDKEIEFDARVWSHSQAEKIPYHNHYTAGIKLAKETPSSPIYDALNLEKDNVISTSGKSFYQNGEDTMFHGSSFHGVKKVLNITPEKITAQCAWHRIKDSEQGQFPVQTFNPYIADIMTHAALIWIQHFHQEKFLPSQTNICECFATIPCDEDFYISCEIKSKSVSSVEVDFIAHNIEGQIYARTCGGKGTIFVPGLARTGKV